MNESYKRVPIDKERVMQMFADLPYPMQVSLLAGLHTGLAVNGGPKGGHEDVKRKAATAPR